MAQAAQSAFTLAEDGDRDAVFDIDESILFHEPESDTASLVLLSDASVVAQGHLREVSPTIDPKTATVRVKVAIDNPPPAMTLGSAVAGTARWKPVKRVMLPWSALTMTAATPAVWLVDPASNTVSLKPVAIDQYESGTVAIRSGLAPGDRVIIEGGKLLSPGQVVTFAEGTT